MLDRACNKELELSNKSSLVQNLVGKRPKLKWKNIVKRDIEALGSRSK